MPDAEQLLANDPTASPADKYRVLPDVLRYSTNVGYPGYANAAVDEVFGAWILNAMFAKSATGLESPEEALARAHTQCTRIWEKWRNAGKV